MTYYDSKRYLSSEKFAHFYHKREQYLPMFDIQKKEYEKTFHKHSMRYSFQLKETWLQETFESMDGTFLTFYHDIPSKETFSSFVKEILWFHDYRYGGKIKKEIKEEEINPLIIQTLINNPLFAYKQETLIYEEGENEIYVMITPLAYQNFMIKTLEKNDYDEKREEQLLIQLSHTLKDILEN